MANWLQKLFNKVDDVPFSLSALKNKQGCLPIDDILAGKYPALAVNERAGGIYEVTHVLPKTGTEVTYKVDRRGNLLAKNVLLGEGNSASSIVHSNSTLYSGDIVDDVYTKVPTTSYINYKFPMFKDAKGFTKVSSKTPNGWVNMAPRPFNF